MTSPGHIERLPGYTFTDGTTAENLVPLDNHRWTVSHKPIRNLHF